ncbi:hypothetical protein RclHR1_09820002 [Rhizophagus clarus]|uniref:Uncharacterized protein n=1 Tax=Rhizophagus clarus TaxID=94130 RepID=A0A2Z6SBH2_9GLOM|nr:hypothetical protein RclHR1_09820002 [Rhizophagus clarus]
MSAITTKFVTDYQLTNEMSIEELSQYVPEIRDLLGDDREKRHQARNRLQKEYKFSKEQAFALIPDQRIGRLVSDNAPEGETIKETAQHIVWDNLSKRDVKDISRTLVETASDPVVTLLRLSRLQRELRTLNAPEKIISATKIPEITRASNKIQQERTKQHLYVVSNTPDKQALADVMIMLCIRFAEIKNLRIANGGIQEAIVSRALKDPGKPGSTYLSSFLKKDEYIPKPYELLLPSSMRKLGAVFASVVHRPKNLSKTNTYASEVLHHSPDNHTSPSDRYTIVNFRRRGQPYDQAKPFWISDEN